MRFEFATSTRIVFGPGTVSEIASLARGLGHHALIVTGSKPQRAEKLLAVLRAAQIATTPFQVDHEPSTADITHGVKTARDSQCDFVIGFGGGAAIDSAKAI